MLLRIQETLTRLYDVEVGVSVEDFLCGAEVAAACGVSDAAARREALLVHEEGEELSLGLYLQERALAVLRDPGLVATEAERFEARCLATEGVSHFLYLSFRAGDGTPVSQLELELQGEVDKYAATLLAAPAAAASEAWLQGNGVFVARSRDLRSRLFDHVRFLDDEGTEAGDRYRLAHRLGARYAASLEARHVARGDRRGLEMELRRFYRLGAREKVEVASRE